VEAGGELIPEETVDRAVPRHEALASKCGADDADVEVRLCVRATAGVAGVASVFGAVVLDLELCGAQGLAELPAQRGGGVGKCPGCQGRGGEGKGGDETKRVPRSLSTKRETCLSISL